MVAASKPLSSPTVARPKNPDLGSSGLLIDRETRPQVLGPRLRTHPPAGLAPPQPGRAFERTRHFFPTCPPTVQNQVLDRIRYRLGPSRAPLIRPPAPTNCWPLAQGCLTIPPSLGDVRLVLSSRLHSTIRTSSSNNLPAHHPLCPPRRHPSACHPQRRMTVHHLRTSVCNGCD